LIGFDIILTVFIPASKHLRGQQRRHKLLIGRVQNHGREAREYTKTQKITINDTALRKSEGDVGKTAYSIHSREFLHNFFNGTQGSQPHVSVHGNRLYQRVNIYSLDGDTGSGQVGIDVWAIQRATTWQG